MSPLRRPFAATSKATAVDHLLQQHPTNPATNSGNKSSINKNSASRYEPISKLLEHTFVGDDGTVKAAFDGSFFEEYADDQR